MVNKTTSLFLCVLACSTALTCRKPPTPQSNASAQSGTAAQPQPPTPPKPMPAQLPDVLARVNGEPVLKADFDRLIRNFEISNGPVPAERRNEILRGALDQLITYTVMAQEAKAQNVNVTEAEVDEHVKQMRGGASKDEFQKALAARHTSMEQLRTDARINLSIGKMMEARTAGAAAATDAEARQFYDKNPDKFKQEVVRASHILLRVEAKTPDPTRNQTRARIDGLLKRARSGEDFAALAREHSQDSSAAAGGDLGYFPRDKMVPAFAQAAFSLKPGEISDVVTTDYGYHIIKVTDRQAIVPYDQVSGQILQFLKRERAGQFVEETKKRARIEVLV